MQKQDIEVGETYLFVATDNPTRKHLEGQPFKVVERKAVFRKLKRGTRKPIRFFNENGVGARAEELGPLPLNEYYVCHACRDACKYGELHHDGDAECGQSLCPNCGAVAQVMGPDLSFADIVNTAPVPLCIGCNKKASELPEYIEAAQEAEITPEDYARTEEGTYNPINGHFLCTDCYIAQGMPTADGGWVAP